MKISQIKTRKNDHIKIAVGENSQHEKVMNGFEHFRLIHDSLPEINKEEIDTSVVFLGKRLKAPIIISSMTGGTEEARRINRILAKSAAKFGIGLALGSMRPVFEDPSAISSYSVREDAPDVFLMGNLGAVQLNYGISPAEVKKVLKTIGADALSLHLNPLQEAIQPEGQTDFSGLIPKIKRFREELGMPVVLKEVGCGISKTTAGKIGETGVDAVDVAGAGGTSWSRIESMRAQSSVRRKLGEEFADWGIPSAQSLLNARSVLFNMKIICSGGLRSGIEVAKAIALGADAAGIAMPLLKAAIKSGEAVDQEIEHLIASLKLSMFLTGSPDIESLKKGKVEPVQE